ncbi:hypothetical protein OHJ21_07560 [Virgibacillus sp. LDC1]|uniref:hypothetical protein n=1 Tax=Paenibacillus TaxID=44249 RepID=UPI000CC72A00|nr:MULTISPECIES: hypothetical protein [Paenibacillus]MCV4231028.1 hypothetical protein [Virgibacillus sp. LDC1]MEC0307495.1 hypothetical protein [Paenibacillus lautus]PJN54919.1 hypothetical protein PAEVO_16400 [Paenibacillus sp. GM2FR]
MKSIVSPNEKINAESWFPGRWIGGLSLVLGPILLLAGELLRVKYHFYYPDQLAAFKEQPTLMAASYGLFAAGIIVMWPGILALVRLIGAKKPGWALWGGILAIMGLFARMYHAGVDNLAYWLVQFQGLELATTFISESYAYNYQGFYVIATILFSGMIGWFVLAIGAFRSRTLNLPYSIALGLMGIHSLGVLKGTSWDTLVAVIGLCVALTPLGIKILQDGPTPSLSVAMKWFIVIVIIGGIFFFVGQNA